MATAELGGPRLYNFVQAAAALGVDRRCVAEMVRAKGLPFHGSGSTKVLDESKLWISSGPRWPRSYGTD